MKLKEFMELKGIRNSEILACCGIGRKTLYNWLCGAQRVPEHHAILIQFYVALKARGEHMNYSRTFFKDVERPAAPKITYPWPATITNEQELWSYCQAEHTRLDVPELWIRNEKGHHTINIHPELLAVYLKLKAKYGAGEDKPATEESYKELTYEEAVKLGIA